MITLPALCGTVTITGTTVVGQTLTADTSALAGSGTISYQWKRGAVNVGTNAAAYTIGISDAGYAMSVTVSRAGYSGTITGGPTAAVTGGLGDLIAALPSTGGTVTLPSGNYDITAAITINKAVTIAAESGAGVTLERGASYTTGPMFDVSPSGNLTLTAGSGGALILDGGYNTSTSSGITSNSAAINVAGSLILGDGVTVKNNKNSTVGTGGGVFVKSGGSLTMNAGSSIEDNEGVDGGGVAVKGTFTMNGGTIQHNIAKKSGENPDGGGVLVDEGVSFFMLDGEIASNVAQRTGGGVAVYSGVGGAEFTMSGGSIHDNVANGSAGGGGGGVHVWRATFTMSGTAAIYGNMATAGEGGGVCVYQSTSTFNMDGGSISSNTTTGLYGGVYNDGGTLNGSATSILYNSPSNTNF
jgi:hypothetical protein